MLNEMCDVYSFGILIMEIISGRFPVDNSRPQGQVRRVSYASHMASVPIFILFFPSTCVSGYLKWIILVITGEFDRLVEENG